VQLVDALHSLLRGVRVRVGVGVRVRAGVGVWVRVRVGVRVRVRARLTPAGLTCRLTLTLTPACAPSWG
jgi:hypothetical protein